MIDTNELRSQANVLVSWELPSKSYSAELLNEAADTIDQQAALIAKYEDGLKVIAYADDKHTLYEKINTFRKQRDFARELIEGGSAPRCILCGGVIGEDIDFHNLLNFNGRRVCAGCVEESAKLIGLFSEKGDSNQ